MALDIIEKRFGKDNLLYIQALTSMAELYSFQGDCQKADSLYQTILSFSKDYYYQNHSLMAEKWDQLGNNYFCLGNYKQAESCFIESKTIIQEKFFDQYPGLTIPIRKLAQINVIQNKHKNSIELYSDFLKRRKSFIRNIFSGSSEKDKLNWLNQYPLFDNSLFSFAFLDNTIASRKLALEMTLTAKAIVNDAMSIEKEAAFCSSNENIENKLQQLSKTNSNISSITIRVMQGIDDKSSQDNLKSLINTQQSLQAELSKLCKEFKEEFEIKNFDIQSVAQTMPSESILCEYIKYSPYDFNRLGTDISRIDDERYLVFTLNHNGDITLNDLGEAKIIDSLIIETRNYINTAKYLIYSPRAESLEDELGKTTHQLYNLLIKPIENKFDNKTQLLFSLDGMLNLIPFDIFKDTDSSYLIEKYTISYLSTGRDILKFSKKDLNSGKAILFADPNFDFSMTKTQTNFINYPNINNNLVRGSTECLTTSYSPLNYSRQESDEIAHLLDDNSHIPVIKYYGDNALESNLKRIDNPPRILHLSTHGFFCSVKSATELDVDDNPIINSGLVFAGANSLYEKDNKDDGILTGYEASGLNLIGTELVTLAACETGVGESVNGEGVFGLRRAFQQAGAKSILMSLWSIPDKKTSELMTNFYQFWLHGKSKKDALRESALKILENSRKTKGHGHPYFWGGFILLGDPH